MRSQRGDGVSSNTAHPTASVELSQTVSTDADLNETSLEQAMIDIAGFIVKRTKIAMQEEN